HDSVDTGPVGRAQAGPEVSRILDPVEHQDQRLACFGQPRLELILGARGNPRDLGDHALMAHAFGEPTEFARIGLGNARAFLPGEGAQFGEALVLAAPIEPQAFDVAVFNRKPHGMNAADNVAHRFLPVRFLLRAAFLRGVFLPAFLFGFWRGGDPSAGARSILPSSTFTPATFTRNRSPTAYFTPERCPTSCRAVSSNS